MPDVNDAIQIRVYLSVIKKCSLQAAEQRLQELDIQISPLQGSILHFLQHEEFTLSELSRKMLLDPSTLVPSVDGLVKKGLIERHRDLNDRRRYPLSLTPYGRKTLKNVVMVDERDPLYQSLEKIGQQDADQLRNILERIVKNLPDGEAMLTEIQERIRLYTLNTE